MSAAAYAKARASAGATTAAARPPAGRLCVGPVDDAFEREADRIADGVMAGGGAARWSFARMDVEPPLQRKCAQCEEEEEKKLQRKPSRPDAARGAAPPIVQEVLRTPGQPLHPLARERFERSFRRSFGNVRVHDDGKAAQSAREISALAYTSGRHIVFAGNRYAQSGDWLLAHELTHVVQQEQGSSAAPSIVQRKDADDDDPPPASKPPKADFNACSEPLQSDLRASQEAGRNQVRWAVASLAGGLDRMEPRDKENFNKYFDPSNSGSVDDSFVRDVRANFERIGATMDSLKFDCDPESGSLCGDSHKWCVQGRLMWTCFGNVHICVDAYNAETNEDRKIESIIHESTHNALHTTDRAYSNEDRFSSLKPRGSGVLAFLSKIPVIGTLFKLLRSNNDTLNNPDSYAMYAMSNRGTGT